MLVEEFLQPLVVREFVNRLRQQLGKVERIHKVNNLLTGKGKHIFDKKIVTIETGTEKKKGYVSVDAYAIYTIFKDEPEQTADVTQTETQPEPEKKVDEQNVAALNAQPEAEAQATDASQDEKQEKKAKKEKKSKDKKVEEKKD